MQCINVFKTALRSQPLCVCCMVGWHCVCDHGVSSAFLCVLHADQWIVADQQKNVYFKNHDEKKRYKISNPGLAIKYKLVFSAVATGCASRSIQV